MLMDKRYHYQHTTIIFYSISLFLINQKNADISHEQVILMLISEVFCYFSNLGILNRIHRIISFEAEQTVCLFLFIITMTNIHSCAGDYILGLVVFCKRTC